MSEIIVNSIPDPSVGKELLEYWYKDVCNGDPYDQGASDELEYLAESVWFEDKVDWGELPVAAESDGYQLPGCGDWDKFYVSSSAVTAIVGKMLDGLDDDDGPHGLAIIRRAYRRHC